MLFVSLAQVFAHVLPLCFSRTSLARCLGSLLSSPACVLSLISACSSINFSHVQIGPSWTGWAFCLTIIWIIMVMVFRCTRTLPWYTCLHLYPFFEAFARLWLARALLAFFFISCHLIADFLSTNFLACLGSSGCVSCRLRFGRIYGSVGVGFWLLGFLPSLLCPWSRSRLLAAFLSRFDASHELIGTGVFPLNFSTCPGFFIIPLWSYAGCP